MVGRLCRRLRRPARMRRPGRSIKYAGGHLFFIRRGTLGKISAGSRWVAAFPCHSVACYENKSSVKRLWFLTSPQSRDFVVLETTIVLYACAGAPSVAGEPVLDRAGGFRAAHALSTNAD